MVSFATAALRTPFADSYHNPLSHDIALESMRLRDCREQFGWVLLSEPVTKNLLARSTRWPAELEAQRR